MTAELGASRELSATLAITSGQRSGVGHVHFAGSDAGSTGASARSSSTETPSSRAMRRTVSTQGSGRLPVSMSETVAVDSPARRPSSRADMLCRSLASLIRSPNDAAIGADKC